MKKTLIFLAAMLMGLSVYAEYRPIYIVRKPIDDKSKKGRSLVVLPTASIDGSTLTIQLVEDVKAHVYVYTMAGEILYSSSLNSLQSVIELPSLENCDYSLEIVQGDEVYVGDFSIEE